MTKKNFWMVIPTLLLPYLALFTLATVFLSTKVAFFKYIMDSVFDSNVLFLIAAFILCCIVATVLDIICVSFSISKKWSALSFAKVVMIIKLIQIPAYILIFILGVLLAITIFTIPFSIALFLSDCLSLALTGALAVSAMINSIRQGAFQLRDVFAMIIMQFVFCADVVVFIIFYIRLKNKTDKTNMPSISLEHSNN